MGGIVGILQEIYIRFMVWLGAEPPESYKYLVQDEPVPQQYRLKEGETIFSVGRKFGINYDLIAQANGIEDPESVKVGQTLTIPGADWTPPAKPEAAPPSETVSAEPEIGEISEALEPFIEPEPPREPVGEIAPIDEVKQVKTDEPVEISPILAEPEEEAALLPEAEQVFRYEIQRGDTLSGVARRYGITVKALVEANDIIDPNRIYPGQKLIIPGYRLPEPPPEPEPQPIPIPSPDEQYVHTVISGDTFNSIAKRYGLTVRELIEANDIENPNMIYAGQKLVIPGVIGRSALPAEALLIAEPEPEPAAQPQPFPTAEIDPNFPPLGPAEAVRALYISYFAIGHAESRQRVLDLLRTTEFNAVVIDAKGDFGWISYPTQLSSALEIGAARPTAKDFGTFLAQLKAEGIYTIARIVTFKDTPLAKNYPDLAVTTGTGQIWQDDDGSGWADPFLKPVWDYNVAIAVEAAHQGFDEIQFAFVRFPVSSPIGTPHFSQEVSKDTRVAAISGFLSVARGQLTPLGVKLAADTFGYTCWRQDDTVIGQDIERMGQYLDVLCPMLYPSTFVSGIPGYKSAIDHPYEIVYESALRAVQRVGSLGCSVRPWIQGFQDYRFDKRVYGRAEIQAQIKGCFDSGSDGFLVWDPKVNYTQDAFAPRISSSP